MGDNLKTVQSIYEAFGRGDVPAILEKMAPDVEWEYAWQDSPVPWLKPGRGIDHVKRFFETLASELQFNAFSVNHLFEGENVVVALASLDATVRSTGKHVIETDEAHICYFNEAGLVSRFRHAADTHQHVLALQKAGE